MQTLYNVLIKIAAFVVGLSQYFSPKMKRFVSGRKNVAGQLHEQLGPSDRPIWFHCASLGEFEQGVPIMEKLREAYPQRKLVVSFFSPSGYEIKKDTPLADAVVYLPMDTPKRVALFLDALKPILAVFVKYEIWPNYLKALEERKVPSVLVSGLFREHQVYFKWYGAFMRNALARFNHIFVQDTASKTLLECHGLTAVTVSGDTRFDRVARQIEMDNRLPFMDAFLSTESEAPSLCLVCGSTWAADEAVLLPFINAAPPRVKIVIAPHKIEASRMAQLQGKIQLPSMRYTEMATSQLPQTQVLIVDTIGLLGNIYSYANIAYVGGGMGSTGLHNILEPATFGVPVVIGQHFDEFPEAKRLWQLAGLFSVSNEEEASSILQRLAADDSFREKTGMIAGHFVNQNTGATKIAMEYLKRLEL